MLLPTTARTLQKARRSYGKLCSPIGKLNQNDACTRILSISICLLLVLVICLAARVQQLNHIILDDARATFQHPEREGDGFPVSLFIAIGSAPKNEHLRQAARDTWLKWIPKDNTRTVSVSYKFFTDVRPNDDVENIALWKNITVEKQKYNDVVEQPLRGGYGDNENNEYSKRALFQMKYALTNHPTTSYYLRIDDDSFLCLHKLIYEMKALPRSQFFWGKFWCKQNRNRADESFMFFSSDIVMLLLNDRITSKLLPFDNHVTLGWNFGYWSWVLNVTVFDDQRRIDSQQHYLTTYMHQDTAGESKYPFCETFMYAHHVRSTQVIHSTFEDTNTRIMYDLPQRTSQSETCEPIDRSFIPRRHSKVLPDVRLERGTGIL